MRDAQLFVFKALMLEERITDMHASNRHLDYLLVLSIVTKKSNFMYSTLTLLTSHLANVAVSFALGSTFIKKTKNLKNYEHCPINPIK